MSEEKNYKYLVDVCELAEVERLEAHPPYNQEGMYIYCAIVKLTDKGEWETFHNMFIRKEDDILFFMSRFHRRVLVLCSMSYTPNPIKGNFELKFKTIGHDLDLDSEFVKGLKKISSVDDIEQSHGDEPGERGEEGVMPVVGMFSSTVDVWECNIPRGRQHTTIIARMTPKTKDFVRLWLGTKPPRKFYYMLDEGSNDLFFLDEVEVGDDKACFKFSYSGDILLDGEVRFSVPTATGPRGTYPTMTVPNKEKEKILSKYVLDSYRDNVKQCVDEYLSLDIHKPDYSGFGRLIGENTEEDKFPQLHRARINKPKSI